MKRMLSLLGMLLFCQMGWAQQYTQVWTDQVSLQQLIEEQQRRYDSLRQVVRQLYDRPMAFEDEAGQKVAITDISPTGELIYSALHNAASAEVISVDSLYENGGMGLSLSGKNMLVGVWDGGLVRASHVELEGRVINNIQGQDEFDSHATHVVGTVIATGVNANAKGMAYEARVLSYDFDGDYISQMATEASNGLLVSNHSYGIISGWRQNPETGEWAWFGGDADEDFKFGFYSNRSRQIDQLAVNAPFYTIVWSEGNDRNDVGDGTKKADGPYDCIGPEGVAKNNITVGAISASGSVTNPANIVMSNFSSWGPTDDGRIKPDIVARGVGVFSVGSSGDEAYATQQGTSMAAPSVAGAVTLLQQHYSNLHDGDYMRSATVKAVMIHSAREAGMNPGPDYSFGWGLFNASGAATLLSSVNDLDTLVVEDQLTGNGTYEITVFSDGSAPLKATLCWTDPAATPVAQSIDPTDLMLINDLDLRVIDDAGAESLPWILDPANPAKAAQKGDNFRDNVEVVLLENPEPRAYRIRVSTKNNLSSPQAFSLVVTAKSTAGSADNILYWIGNDGEWGNETNWSLQSGGVPSNTVPDSATTVIFDENSFSTANPSVQLTADAACKNLFWIYKDPAMLDLNGHALQTYGSILSNTPSFQPANGSFEMRGDAGTFSEVRMKNSVNSLGAGLKFNAPGKSWNVTGEAYLDHIEVLDGEVNMARGQYHIRELLLENGMLNMDNLTIDTLQNVSVADGFEMSDAGAVLNFTYPVGGTVAATNKRFGAHFSFGAGNFQVDSENATFPNIYLHDTLTFLNSSTVTTFAADTGATLMLAPNMQHRFSNNFDISGKDGNPFTIRSMSGTQNATLYINDYVKLCFDYLDISGVDFEGNAAFNAGPNSAVDATNTGWIQAECDDVIFAGFDYDFNCVNGFTFFKDMTSGRPLSWEWEFIDPVQTANMITEDQNPSYVFTEVGDYAVSLKVGDGENFHSIIDSVTIIENSLPIPVIVESGEVNLAVTASAPNYQWFVNGDSIPGATQRVYAFNGEPGVYQVMVANEECNAVSEVFTVTGLENALDAGFDIYPNPVKNGTVYIEAPNFRNKVLSVEVMDLLGKKVKNTLTQHDGKYTIRFAPEVPSGLFLLKLVDETDNRVFTHKLFYQK